MKRITKLFALSIVTLLGACGEKIEGSSEEKFTALDGEAIKALIEAIPEDVDLDYVSARQVIATKDYEAKAFYLGHEAEFEVEYENPVDYFAMHKTETYVNTKYTNRVVEQLTKISEIYLDDPTVDYGVEYVDLFYPTEDDTFGELLNMATHYFTEGYEDFNSGMALPAIYVGYDTYDDFLADCYYGYSLDGVDNFFCKDEMEGYTTSITGKQFEDGSWEATYSYETTLKYGEYMGFETGEILELPVNPDMKERAEYTVKFENGECVWAFAKDAFYISNSIVDGAAYNEEQLVYETSLTTDQMTKEVGEYTGEFYPCELLF